MVTEAEFQVMWPQAKEVHSHQELEEATNRFSPIFSTGSTALQTP